MKKVLLWVVSAVLALSAATFGVNRMAEAVSSTENSGEHLYTFRMADRTASEAVIALKNQVGSAASVQIFAASYSETGQMLSIAGNSQTLENSQEVQITLNTPENTDCIKAFVLDASGLKPLRAAWTYEKTKSDASEKNIEKLLLQVGGRTLTATLADNSTVDALKELLKDAPITLDMSDYAGFEKGAPLPKTLPQNNEPMHTDAGDIILYQGRQFVIYYDQNSWSLTPIGKVDGITKSELKTILGTGNVTVTISLTETS